MCISALHLTLLTWRMCWICSSFMRSFNSRLAVQSGLRPCDRMSSWRRNAVALYEISCGFSYKSQQVIGVGCHCTGQSSEKTLAEPAKSCIFFLAILERIAMAVSKSLHCCPAKGLSAPLLKVRLYNQRQKRKWGIWSCTSRYKFTLEYIHIYILIFVIFFFYAHMFTSQLWVNLDIAFVWFLHSFMLLFLIWTSCRLHLI